MPNIYILYIDFTNAFGSIDHARFLAIMENLGYCKMSWPWLATFILKSTTTYLGEHFGKMEPSYTKRNHTRKYLEPILLSYLSRTTPQIVTKEGTMHIFTKH